MMRISCALILGVLVLAARPALAELPGWSVTKTPHSYEALIARLNAAVKANKMGLVTRASASYGAAARGLEIPGNMVVGVYRNDFAVRMLEASVAAGIEAPIRFYITGNGDGTATLSYKTPSFVFAPYEDGGAKLKGLAKELDAIFAKIAREAAAR
ncbi:MAG: DUF302 domain-containing protein [Kiloniellaceae bacterium]